MESLMIQAWNEKILAMGIKRYRQQKEKGRAEDEMVI